MLKIRIVRNRFESAAGYTHARLLVDEGGFLCWTLEDEDRGLTQEMPITQIERLKVKGKTAIPKGTYRGQIRISPKFKDRPWAQKYGGRLLYLRDVPGFEGVCIHPLNTPEETMGCIGVGMLHSGIRGRIFDSQKAFFDLMDYYVIPEWERNGEIWITIE